MKYGKVLVISLSFCNFNKVCWKSLLRIFLNHLNFPTILCWTFDNVFQNCAQNFVQTFNGNLLCKKVAKSLLKSFLNHLLKLFKLKKFYLCNFKSGFLLIKILSTDFYQWKTSKISPKSISNPYKVFTHNIFFH